MRRGDILRALAQALEALPAPPEEETLSALREYDEALSAGLEDLRDTVRAILEDCGMGGAL